jgi:preprotein translocase subunit Sss1
VRECAKALDTQRAQGVVPAFEELQMKRRKTPGRKSGSAKSRGVAAIRHVIEQEKRVWKAAQDRDAKEFKKLVPADAVMIFQSGMVRQPEYVKTMKSRTVSHTELQDMHGFMPNSNTVVLIYQTVRIGNYDGEEFPSTPVIESTTWIKRGKRWVAILNQETPVTN